MATMSPLRGAAHPHRLCRLKRRATIFHPTGWVKSTGAGQRYGGQSLFCLVKNLTKQLPSGIKGTGPSSGPPDLIKS